MKRALSLLAVFAILVGVGFVTIGGVWAYEQLLEWTNE